jgi:lipopolysaccharide/colanic/teichoic acid biosynthesis glycosyltransferase
VTVDEVERRGRSTSGGALTVGAVTPSPYVHALTPDAVAAIDAALEPALEPSPQRTRRIVAMGGPNARIPFDLARLITHEPSDQRADVVIICPPEDGDELLGPNLSAMEQACAAAVAAASPGQILIMTTAGYVGSARDMLVMPLTKRGLVAGEHVHVVTSPEPIPGAVQPEGRVVGGATPECSAVAADIFAEVGPVTRFTTLEDAEATSLSSHAPASVGAFAKRLIDIVGAAVGLVVLLPVMLVIALAVRLDSPGPVLFSQERVGRYGRRFQFRKFRTMTDGAEQRLSEVLHLNGIKGPAFQIDSDPRVTRIGRFLRKSSLDELPELWAVLRGYMSLVGPRPAPVVEVASYRPWHRRRLAVKPGITGLAQVRARKYSEFDVKAGLDLLYIDHWTLWLDIRLLLETLPAVLRYTGR